MSGRIGAAIVAMTVAIGPAETGLQTPASAAASRTAAADFLGQLKRAVEGADRRAVSAMIAYPLTVLASGFNIPVKDASAFIRMYNALLTPELRCALVESEMPTAGAPAPHRAAVITPDGLSVAEGAVWAPFKEGRYRIARIRVPPAAPSVEGRKGIEPVTFAEAKGERSATFAGWLVRQNVDAYMVTLKKGETLHVRVDGFRGHDATLRISPQADAAVRARAQMLPDIGRTSSTAASVDADYVVEIAHLARYCDPPQRYKLTVTVR